ncbi:hypothetical protein Hanom_Chr09g00831211 [Helianthus anomalus]
MIEWIRENGGITVRGKSLRQREGDAFLPDFFLLLFRVCVSVFVVSLFVSSMGFELML